MDHMIKVVDTFTGIINAGLDPGMGRAKDILGHMAMARVIGKHYGCDEVQVVKGDVVYTVRL